MVCREVVARIKLALVIGITFSVRVSFKKRLAV
jgi:hypothetical protein